MEANLLSGPDILVLMGLGIIAFGGWVVLKCLRAFVTGLRGK